MEHFGDHSCGWLGVVALVAIPTSASLISSLSSMLSTVRHPWLMLSYRPASSLTRSFSKGRGDISCRCQVFFHLVDTLFLFFMC